MSQEPTRLLVVRCDVHSLSPAASARGLRLLFTQAVSRVKPLGEAEGRIISSVFPAIVHGSNRAAWLEGV